MCDTESGICEHLQVGTGLRNTSFETNNDLLQKQYNLTSPMFNPKPGDQSHWTRTPNPFTIKPSPHVPIPTPTPSPTPGGGNSSGGGGGTSNGTTPSNPGNHPLNPRLPNSTVNNGTDPTKSPPNKSGGESGLKIMNVIIIGLLASVSLA